MTFYWKQCCCNSWWPLPFARRTLPGCSQAKPSRRNLQGWPQHWSGRLSSRWRMLQIWIGNCLVFFFFKFMFFKISGCAHFLCYLQHLGAGTLEFASHLQHFGAETFHFECYLQHFIFGTFLSACYLQHLGAGTNDICSIFELQLSILHGNFLFGW